MNGLRREGQAPFPGGPKGELSIGLRHTAQGLVSGTIGEAWGQGCRTGRGAEGQGQEAGSMIRFVTRSGQILCSQALGLKTIGFTTLTRQNSTKTRLGEAKPLKNHWFYHTHKAKQY